MADVKGPPRENLIRASHGIELTRDAGDPSAMPTLHGFFAVYGQFTEIRSAVEGHFMERFSVGSMDKTIRESGKSMKVLLEHGRDPSVGQKPIAKIRSLESRAEGAHYEADLLDATYVRDLLPALDAGLYGASFRFKVLKEDYVARPKPSALNKNGIPERTVTEASVAEFGPVLFPAYPGASAGLRSLTDLFLFNDLTDDPERLRALIEEKKSRTITTSAPTTRVVFTSRASEPEVTREDTPTRLYERSVEFVGESVWAVHPGTLATIVNVIRERRAGVTIDAEEIKQRIKASPVPGLDMDENDLEAETPDPADAVAVIPLHGAIVPHATMFSDVSGAASVDDFTSAFRAAISDESKQSVLIDINSPGGAVELIPELAAEILAARGSKPIVAMVNAFAASAAYWIASCCDEIVVTPSGQVGSIGVYAAHEDLSAAEEKLGIKTTLVSAGKYKTEGNPFEPLTDEAEADMQAKVDAYYQMFVQAVAAGRDVKASDVIDGFGQGRMVLAADAVKANMADKIGTYDDTLARLTKAADTSRSSEPEPSAATTPPPGQTEPERPVATTRATQTTTGLFIPKPKGEPWQL